MKGFRSGGLVLAAAVVGWLGCGGGGDDAAGMDAGVDETVPHRPVTLTAVRPATVSAGGAAYTLEADGTFEPDAVVIFAGRTLETRVVSTTLIEADVPAEAIATPGVRSVQIIHAEAGGGVSSSRPVTVVDGVASPVLGQLIPDRLSVGSPAADILVEGWNFTPDTIVHWNAQARATTFIASNRVRIAATAADFAAEGSASVIAMTGANASSALTFTIEPPPSIAVGVTDRISVSPSGGDAAMGSSGGGALSADGRYVVFSSYSDEIVGGDANGQQDVFLRDTCRGATSCTPSTIRISVSATGGDADGGSYGPVITPDGRYVAFTSGSTDLTGQTVPSGEGVFVRDTCIGATGACTPATSFASPVPGDLSIAFTFAGQPSISADGRIVAFYAFEPTFGQQVYWYDSCRGATSCTPTSERISESGDGTPGNLGSGNPALDASGRYVAFGSRASLDGQPVTNGGRPVYVLDTCHGATGCTRSLTRATVGIGGTEAEGFAINISISADARYVGFTSYGTNLTTHTIPNFSYQAYLRDTCTGATSCTPTTIMVSAIGSSAANDHSYGSAVSATGRYVVFMSEATDLVPGDTNGSSDVFVRDLCIGATACSPQTRRVSVSSMAVQGDGSSHPDQERGPWITSDGSLTGWSSNATNLVVGDANGATDTFVASTGFP